MPFQSIVINIPRSIYKYSNMAPRFSGWNYFFLSFICLSIPQTDLDTKKTTPKKQFCPESLRALLDYWPDSLLSASPLIDHGMIVKIV